MNEITLLYGSSDSAENSMFRCRNIYNEEELVERLSQVRTKSH